jgi:hypothetical protein
MPSRSGRQFAYSCNKASLGRNLREDALALAGATDIRLRRIFAVNIR